MTVRIQGRVFEEISLRDLVHLSEPDLGTALRWLDDRRAAEAKRQAEAGERAAAIAAELTEGAADRHRSESAWAARNMPT
jgi:hypothetical protein